VVRIHWGALSLTTTPLVELLSGSGSLQAQQLGSHHSLTSDHCPRLAFSRSSRAASRCTSISLSLDRVSCRLSSTCFSSVSTRTALPPTSSTSLYGRRSS